MSTKPDRFVDQSDADVKALEFLEAVAAKWSTRIPGVTIHHANHVNTEGRTSYVFGQCERRLLAVSVIVRDAMNYSLLVTREFDDTGRKVTPFRPCDQCEHFIPAEREANEPGCRMKLPMDFQAPRAGVGDDWGYTRPDCEHFAKAKE